MNNTIATLDALWTNTVKANNITFVGQRSIDSVFTITGKQRQVSIPQIRFDSKINGKSVSVIYDNVGGSLHAGDWKCIEMYFEGSFDVLVITQGMIDDERIDISQEIKDWLIDTDN